MESTGIPPEQQPDAVAAETGEQESPQVQALRQEIADANRQVEELTRQTQQQADQPASAPGSTDVRDLLNQLVQAQSQQRSEVQALRNELAKTRSTPLPTSTASVASPEELLAIRMDEVNSHPFYCPACGRTYDYRRECTGRAEAPHPAVDVVSTDELKNPPDSTDREAVREHQAEHTRMEYINPQDNVTLLTI